MKGGNHDVSTTGVAPPGLIQHYRRRADTLGVPEVDPDIGIAMARLRLRAE